MKKIFLQNNKQQINEIKEIYSTNKATHKYLGIINGKRETISITVPCNIQRIYFTNYINNQNSPLYTRFQHIYLTTQKKLFQKIIF
jgi:hypothetical protein